MIRTFAGSALPESVVRPLTLYRQSQIFAREGIDLERSTLTDWVGRSTALLEPLADAIGRHVLRGDAIFADDTPVKVLTPGAGRDNDRKTVGLCEGQT